jgi:hypothetical protein
MDRIRARIVSKSSFENYPQDPRIDLIYGVSAGGQ